MPVNSKDEALRQQIRGLRELIEALERRVPRIERAGEAQIARDAAGLMKKALARIAELERERERPESRGKAPRPA